MLFTKKQVLLKEFKAKYKEFYNDEVLEAIYNYLDESDDNDFDETDVRDIFTVAKNLADNYNYVLLKKLDNGFELVYKI